MAEPTAERLTRLLALITYLGEHPGVTVAQVAHHFGISESQVLSDVDTLWVSGTPGYQPDDLIDFSYDAYERGVLTLTNPRKMDKPLRLAPGEAFALLVALRSLARMPEVAQTDVVGALIGKLESAAGEAGVGADAVDVRITSGRASGASARALEAARRALREERRLHLRYVSAADVVSEREVDPWQLLADGDQWYLRAWCHRAQDVRHFRLDRVLDARVLDVAAEHPPEQGAGGFHPEPELSEADPHVTLEVTSRSRWVAERFGGVDVTDTDDGWIRLRLPVADPAWIAGLVLGLGDQVRAVEPRESAELLAARARSALAAYRDAGLT